MSDHQLEIFKHLKGKYVTLTIEDGQVQVRTDDGWALHIYNAFTLSGDDHASATEQGFLRSELIDCLLDQNSRLSVIFSDHRVLTVDMTDDGYSGPEAMQLNGPDGSIIIWS